MSAADWAGFVALGVAGIGVIIWALIRGGGIGR